MIDTRREALSNKGFVRKKLKTFSNGLLVKLPQVHQQMMQQELCINHQ